MAAPHPPSPFGGASPVRRHGTMMSRFRDRFVPRLAQVSLLERARSATYSQMEVGRGLPADMVARHLERAGFRVVDAQTVPIGYRERFVHSQLDLCLHAIGKLRDQFEEEFAQSKNKKPEAQQQLHDSYRQQIAKIRLGCCCRSGTSSLTAEA